MGIKALFTILTGLVIATAAFGATSKQPPVVAKPFQIRHHASGRILVLDVQNTDSSAARITVESAHTLIVPAHSLRRLEAPVKGAKAQVHYSVQLGPAHWTSWIDLAGVPDTLIPFGEREAPIPDQLWALAPRWKMPIDGHYVRVSRSSPAGFSATAQFQYDETGLWMRFIVTDEVMYQTETGRSIWRDDSVKISIQPNGSTSSPRHSFGFALTPQGPTAVRYGGPGGWTGTLDVQRRGKQTTYDARIAWPDIAPLKPVPGERFRMNFLVNDNDGDGRLGWLQWTPGILPHEDPSRWMEWTLAAPGPEPTSM